MKKIIVFLAAAAATLAACQREQDTGGNQPAEGDACTVKVRASVPNALQWGAGEQMMLAVSADGNTVFAPSRPLEASSTAQEAQFYFDMELPGASRYSYQGFYPASAADAEDNENPAAYKLVLPSVQEAAASSFDPRACILLASPASFTDLAAEWAASLRPAVELNRLTLQGLPSGKSIRMVEVIAPEGVFLSGGRMMNLSMGTKGDFYAGSRSVEIQYAAPLAGGAPIEVCFASWESGNNKALSLIAYTSDDFSYSTEITLPVTKPVNLAEITPQVCCFSGGNGTEASPWRIATAQDLAELSEFVSVGDTHFNSDHYRQTADIDLAGGYHEAIGNSNATPSYFKGVYEGYGHKVSNLVIRNQQTDKAVGFFGYLDGNARVDGLVLEHVSLSSNTWNNGSIVGCIQPGSTVIVQNCVVTDGSVSSNNTDNGGICGKQMGGTVRNCSYQGTVKATGSTKHRLGGIVGQVCADGALVADCFFDGTVSGTCGNVGGIVGSLYGSASVTGCATTDNTVVEGGSVADNGINIGGIVGYVDNRTGGRIENCTFPGQVIGHYYEVGGIAGRDQGLVIRNCSFSGSVTSDWDESGAKDDTYGRVGGICGHVHGTGYVENCQVSGTVGSDARRVSYTGGVVGWLEQGSIVGCTIPQGQTLVVKGKAITGGVVGQFKSGIVKSCSMDGLDVSTSGNYAGGIAGRMNVNASLTNCAVDHTTVDGGVMCAGGICGLFSGGGYIAQCTVSGTSVTAGTKLAGGILGNMDSCSSAASSKVERCTVRGGSGLSVCAATQGIAGGILGGSNTYGCVNLCTSSIDVYNKATGSYGNVGGIVGWVNSLNMLVANCVYYGGELHSDEATGSGVGGICGQFSASAQENSTLLVNCAAFPSLVSSKAGNVAGIAGYVNTVTIRNCYSPVPGDRFLVDGGTSNKSRGSIYGWLRGISGNETGLSGTMTDVYWLSGWTSGNSSGSYQYVKHEQALTDAQMRNGGSVTRPSTSASYGSFLEALNASAADYNASPLFDVLAAEWVMGSDGYPVPYGTGMAAGGAVSSKKKVSLLGDSITTYQGWTAYPNNYEYPKASSYPDFTSVTQTWWYQLIYQKMSSAVLEVNSSYCGTQIQDHASQGHPGYGFLQRYVDLGNPDIILINGGTNDISRDLPMGSLDFSIPTEQLDTYQFAQAYDKLIRLVRERYPSALVLCILGDRYFDGMKTSGAAATAIVHEICTHYGVPYAEVNFGDQRSTCRYQNGSNVHPTPEGMSFMADAVWQVLEKLL